jgi:hypothetical protein
VILRIPRKFSFTARKLRAISPSPARFSWGVYLALVALAWLANYPGRINPDTLDQLTQARNLATLNDCQAPVLTWLYSLFTPVLGQPSGALLIQAMLMFVFPAIVFARTHDRRVGFADMDMAFAAAWGVLTAALVAITGQILKDVVEVGAILCLLGTAELRSTTRNPARLWWFALALLALIDTLRPTTFLMLAVAATICALFAFGLRRKFFVALLLIGVLSAGAFALPNYVNRKVLGAKDCGEQESLIVFDIAGMATPHWVAVNIYGVSRDVFYWSRRHKSAFIERSRFTTLKV